MIGEFVRKIGGLLQNGQAHEMHGSERTRTFQKWRTSRDPPGGPMRTRSFFLLLVAVPMAMSAEKPIRQSIPNSVLSIVTRDQRGGISRPSISGFVRQQAPQNLPRSITEVVVPVEMKRLVAERSLRNTTSPGGSTAPRTSATLTGLTTPFDTVYEQGFYGKRRYVFTTNENGNLIRRSNQKLAAQGWEETSRVECTYSPGGLLLSKIEYDPAYIGGVSWRNVFVYDFAERMTSGRYESIDAGTGGLISAMYDSTVFDDQGDVFFSQSEWWYNGPIPEGGKYTSEGTDSSYVSTRYARSPEGWTPVSRQTWFNHPVNGGYEYLEQEWQNGRWENAVLCRYESNYGIGEEWERSWIWVDDRWRPDTRSLFISLDSLLDALGPYGDSWVYLTERWTGRDWVPARRQIGRDAGDQINSSYRREVWDDGWIPEHVRTNGWGDDGLVRSIDSTWEGRWLRLVEVEDRPYLGMTLYERFEWWDGPEKVVGGVTERIYTPSGREAQSTEYEWKNNTWEAFAKYVLTYDANDRITSLVHSIRTPAGWVPSAKYSDADTSGHPGTSWYFETQATRPGYREFYGFAELTFHYRNTVSDVAGQIEEVPRETALRQNYPNPFNPATTLPFSIAVGARTTIAIFDILGREVSRPVDEWKEPGEYKVQFDASKLASGMYICRFTSGNVNQTRKLMLIR